MSFQPLPCSTSDGSVAVECCPTYLTGFCLEDGTSIAIVLEEEVQTGWVNLQTGAFTFGAPPAGTIACVGGSPSALDCSTDSITVCSPASGVFEVGLDEASLASLETVTVIQGTSPWVVSGTSDWVVSHAPASGVQASASKAAVVGSRHVATSISFSVITTTTAPTTMTLTVTLRDGATGVGGVLMSWRVRVSAAMTDQNVAQVTLGSLNIIGTENTAMTLEFDVGDINTLEDVNLTGHTV